MAARLLTAAARLLLGLGMAVLVLGTLTQVLLRYLFGESILWVEEASVILLIGLTWLGVSLLWFEGSHIRVDLLPALLPPRPRRAVAGLVASLALAGAGALAWIAQDTIAVYESINLAVLPFSAAVKYWPISLGAGLLALAVFARAVVTRLER